MLNGSNARADFSDCTAGCYAIFARCCFTSSNESFWVQSPAVAACQIQLLACYAFCEAQATANFAVDCANWLANNPGAVVGAVVFVGAVACLVVLTQGGALALVAL